MGVGAHVPPGVVVSLTPCPKPARREKAPRKPIPRRSVRPKRRKPKPLPDCARCKAPAADHTGTGCRYYVGLRERRPARVRRSTMGKLRKDLDDLFAAYVKDRDGNVCISCGTTITRPNDWHAGHFIRRGYWSLRWDPKNCHAQCGFVCNLKKRGNGAAYALAILDRYGAAELLRLGRLKNVEKKWTRPELEELIAALRKGGADFEALYFERHSQMGAALSVVTEEG